MGPAVSDYLLVGAIEITRLPNLPEDPLADTIGIALAPQALDDPQSDVRIAQATGSAGLALPEQEPTVRRGAVITAPDSYGDHGFSAPEDMRTATAYTHAAEPDRLLALNGSAYALGDAFQAQPVAQPELIVAMREAPAMVAEPSPGGLPQVQIAMAEAAETAMSLSRVKRRELQVRLSLIGYNPKGSDGVFGPNTRQAISELQLAEARPVTGFLDPSLHELIVTKSHRKFARLERARRKARLARAQVAPVRNARIPTARNAPECARDGNGVIISNQSFSCDVTVLEESLEDLFSGTVFSGPSG